MNIDKIAQNIIAGAVKTHLSNELKAHCAKTAKLKATAWLKKNSKSIDASIEAEVSKTLDAQVKEVVKKAAKGITMRAPVRRHSYY